LPVEDFTDIDLGIDEKTFDQLDRAAAKAEKSLEKRNKELKKSLSAASKAEREQKRLDQRGGIFAEKEEKLPSGKAPSDIAAPDKIPFLDEIDDKIKKGVQDNIKVSFREAFADQAGGLRGANNMLAFAKNPVGFTKGLMKAIPFIGGIVAIGEFGQALIAELEKLDAFFKKFIDIIDTRVNQLITKTQQAKIRAGDIQEILATEAGGTRVRVPYNTHNEFNKDRLNFENDHNIRTVVDT